MASYEELRSYARIIRNETKSSANTALRIGEMYLNIIDKMEDVDDRFKDFLTGTDTDNIINRWKELESFLNGYTETSTLAELLSGKADKATTLAGYGITNAYTKTEVDNKITSVNTSVTTLQTTVSGHTTSINSLQGYFTNGVANFASRLSDGAEYKAWGKVFFKDGKPVNVSGEGTFTQVNADSVLLKGKARLSYDSNLNALLLTRDDGTAVHFLASGAVATRGLGEIEEGGGGTGTGVDLLNVPSDIIPSANSTYNLGSSTNAWKMIYANGGIIGNTYIDSSRVIFGTYIQGQSWAINPDGSASLGSITSNGEPVATRNWVNSHSFAKTSDLINYVTLNSAQTISGKKTFTGGITVNNGITASRLYSVDYLDSSELIINAEKVNFIYDDEDADVQIGLINGYKPLTLGNTSFSPALTSGTVIGTITIGGESKKIYAPSSSSVDLSNYVTLDSEQTITGSKYFSDLNANSIYLQGFELKPYNPDGSAPDRLMYDGYVLLDEFNYSEYLDSAYIKKSGGTVTGKLGFTGGTYPQIYGDGNYLTLSPASDGLYGLTFDKPSAAIRARADKNTQLGTPSVRWYTIYSDKGNFSGQITSTVADGTAPFVVASKTEVANLHSATASKLHTAHTIAISGAVTGTATTFDGSRNISINTTSVDASKLSGYAKMYYGHHPEDEGLLPFIYNDLAYLSEVGGACSIYTTTDTDYTKSDLTKESVIDGSYSVMFDCSPRYQLFSLDSTSTVLVIDIDCPTKFAYANKFYIDFGNYSWIANEIKVYVWNDAADNTSKMYELKAESSSVPARFMASLSYSYSNGTSTVQGFNKLRVVLTDFARTNPRIAQIGLINMNSFGARMGYVSRGIDDKLYRNFTPAKNLTYNLGNGNNRWLNIYGQSLDLSDDATIRGSLTTGGNILPSVTKTLNLGQADKRWNVYAASLSAVNVTSSLTPDVVDSRDLGSTDLPWYCGYIDYLSPKEIWFNDDEAYSMRVDGGKLCIQTDNLLIGTTSDALSNVANRNIYINGRTKIGLLEAMTDNLPFERMFSVFGQSNMYGIVCGGEFNNFGDDMGAEYANWWIMPDGVGFFQSVENLSDVTKKSVIGNVQLSISDIAAAPSIYFTWTEARRNKKARYVGTTAQYWNGLLPELVSHNNGVLSLDYATLGVTLGINIAREVNTMKMWQTSTTDRIEELEDKVKKLEEENKELRELLNSK